MRKKCIIIHGPTGVGKTDLSLKLARNYNGQIINGDVGQFYEPLSIGTAKPDWKNESIPHHLFDIVATPHNYTVVEYRHLVLSTMQALWDKNVLPIIVGGSGFYLRSLFFPPLGYDGSTTLQQSGTWQDLYDLDPERAQAISPHDTYRIERALTLLQQGKKASDCKPVYQDLGCDVLFIWLERDRAELYDRINQRVERMLQEGWVQEVASLLHTDWHTFIKEKKLIGYDLLIEYLTLPEQHTLADVQARIAQKTRHYAKRQHTFWKMVKRSLLPYFLPPSTCLEVSLSAQDGYTSLVKNVDSFMKEYE